MASSGFVVKPVTSTRPVSEQPAQALQRQRLIIDEIGTEFHRRGKTISTTE